MADIVLGAGRGEGLQSQQLQHEIEDRGNFQAQQGQWLRGASTGETLCWRDMRQMDFTGGTQQLLIVVGMGEREKSK